MIEIVHCPLSAREIEIVRHLAQGQTAKDIARKIGLTHFSINERIKTMRRVVGANNTPHLTAMALRKGWIE